ncbi:hypothetical protein LTR05_005870 [Lithohypha guttulata]|uniref:Inner centromere protein ARK-binding domain-containing protein n=1 Tax=Lithohypha guttulata TaxID=1690604 RepID=A0AAN7SZ62_9EURO|nr:hypothetical protein LTR05_005870 [Lithohypha guttulata]
MATNLLVATVPWISNEKAAAEAFFVQEKQESAFPVKAQLLWLNEHLSGILKDEASNVFAHFKTPGRRQGDTVARPLADKAIRNSIEHSSPLKNAITRDTSTNSTPTRETATPAAIPDNAPLQDTPMHDSPIYDPAAEEDNGTTQENVAAIHEDGEATTPMDIEPVSEMSLGLSSESDVVYLRAPELDAHEQRMAAYETSSPTLPQAAIEEELQENPWEEPKEDPLEESEDEPIEEAQQDVEEDTEEEIQEEPQEEVEEEIVAPVIPRPSIKRPASSLLRAPKNLGRPVRPAMAAAKSKTQPQPIAIKIKTLSTSKPVNSAPVAAHNLENVRPGLVKPELSKKASIQSINTFTKSTTKGQANAAKAISLAQKKKELDEQAAARDAAIKQQLRERRDQKFEELKRNKLEEEAELFKKAKDHVAGKRKSHLEDLDYAEVKRRKSEERQEREQAAADAKKAAFREMQSMRQIRPAVKSAVPKPQNIPARPPARLDLHEDMIQEESTPPRLGAHLRQPSLQKQPEPELPAYPSNLSKPPVRVASLNKKPSIFTSTQAGPSTLHGFPQPSRAPTQMPQMGHFATQKIPFATQAPSKTSSMDVVAPMRNMQKLATSPMSLPEIHTDSSDDSGKDRSVASWATPGHVFGMLSQQEAINADSIFPRIRPIVMDDVFAANPERLKRLRVRTSSANWIRTGDGLNQVEVVEDIIGRQAIKNAGGWTYGAVN